MKQTRAALLAAVLLLAACGGEAPPAMPSFSPDSLRLRVAAFNVEDVRTDDLAEPLQPRLQAIARLLQEIRPDVVLLSEVAYDQPGAPGYRDGDAPGLNGQRFVETFLAVPQGQGLEPLRYHAFQAPTNTGEASGFDLDANGAAVTTVPAVPGATSDGAPGPQTAEGRAYGNDAWGFGTFPGQYGMLLLVREDFEILDDQVRTFRLLPWRRLPGALLPIDPATGDTFYPPGARDRFRLSSKSHWDVPVRLPNGTVLHVLASHPTPPAFDGAEQRNVRRNHDEIRFWADYLDGAAYVVDDSSRAGGLPPGAPFVLLGDLNADPDEGRALDDPVGRFLLRHARINGAFVPRADSAGAAAYPELDADDTAVWGLRVDYVLPSAGLRVLGGRVVRYPLSLLPRPSDHFPVYLDLLVPPSRPEGQREAAP